MDSIAAFHAQVVAWAGEGRSLREIADLLNEHHGLGVDHNAVGRYCRKHGVTLQTKPGPRAKPAVAPPAPKPVPAASLPTPDPFPNSAGTSALDVFGVTDSVPEPAVNTDPAATPPSARPDPPPQPVDPLPPEPVPTPSSRAHTPEPPIPAPEPSPTARGAPESTAPEIVPPDLPLPAMTQFPPVPPDRSVYPDPWRYPPLPFPPEPTPPAVWNLDLPLLQFGGGSRGGGGGWWKRRPSSPPPDRWTLGDACEGTLILGATGSGKTSGSGRTIARSFLGAGFGGLVLTVKEDERALWEDLCIETGRAHNLCIVEPGGSFMFNFLDYEARRPDAGAEKIENIVHLFQTLTEVHGRARSSVTLDRFWTDAGNQLLRNVLRVLACARSYLALEDVMNFVREAPLSLAAVKDGSWQATACFGPALEEAYRASRRIEPIARMVDAAVRYWLAEFPALADKTRSILVTNLSAMADALFEPTVHHLFCGHTTIVPEQALDGAVILLDLPLKRYDATGLLAQSIWKLLFQKAVERRAGPNDATRRPVFLWVDEAQHFSSAYDAHFQATARASRCATAYLTQNVSNYYGTFGGDRAKVDGFFGNLNTKVFHANNDPESNRWAAEQIGRDVTYRGSSNVRPDGRGGSEASSGINEHIDYEVQPSVFTRLRTGGHRHGGLVDAYFVKSGATFGATGKHYFPTVFRQELRT